MNRAAFWLAAPLAGAAIYWLGLTSWFLGDDFAWLGLPARVESKGLWAALFEPQAQGTIRVFSERLFFLAFGSMFGLNALPFHLWVLLTQCANLALATAIGARLTGNRAAGFWAGLLWIANPQLSVPMSWVSAYNQILCGFFLLAAFYSLLRAIETGERKWWIVQWLAFLAGFGALELTLMYPAIATVYTLCFAREHLRRVLPMFFPSAIFGSIHLFFIPKATSPVYAMSFDERMFANFARYIGWAIGPSRIGGLWREELRATGYLVTVAIGIALAMFVWKAAIGKKRAPLAIFCCAWFVLLLAPVLPLVNHVSDYYLTLPVIGLCWLGGWAMVEGRRSVVVILTGLYFAGSIVESQAITGWYDKYSHRAEAAVRAVESAHRAKPGNIILLSGVDNELFHAAFQDDPFRLVGAQRVYLSPGSEAGIEARSELGGIERFQIKPADVAAALERGEVSVLSISGTRVVDATRRYNLVARSQLASTPKQKVMIGDPADAGFLGPTWYPPESGFRWMGKSASVILAGPASPGQHLFVNGYAPPAAVKDGPVTLRFRADSLELGSSAIKRPDAEFTLRFALPAALAGRASITIAIEADRVLRLSGDVRELGMIFTSFEIR